MNRLTVVVRISKAARNSVLRLAGMMAKEQPHAQMLEGKPVAEAIKQEVAQEVTQLRQAHGVTPRLAAVLVGNDPASAVYVRNKVRACEEVGIQSEKIELPSNTTSDDLISIVRRLNAHDEVD